MKARKRGPSVQVLLSRGVTYASGISYETSFDVKKKQQDIIDHAIYTSEDKNIDICSYHVSWHYVIIK